MNQASLNVIRSATIAGRGFQVNGLEVYSSNANDTKRLKNMKKTALILGVSGQDGSYLAKFLLSKGYRVVGSSRDAQMSSFSNLKRLRIYDAIDLESVSLNDFRSVLQVLKKVRPNEIYNLAGQTSVGLSFEQPVESFESISIGTLNLLESIRFFKHSDPSL